MVVNKTGWPCGLISIAACPVWSVLWSIILALKPLGLGLRLLDDYGWHGLGRIHQWKRSDDVFGGGDWSMSLLGWPVHRDLPHTHTHTVVYDHTLRGPLLFFLLLPNSRQPYRLCTRMTSEDSWEQRTDSQGHIVPIEKCPRTVWLYKLSHTHTHTCKHRQTGSSHCSSSVYTLTFSQHLSYVLYTFGKRGAFFQLGTLLFLLL